MMDNKYIRTEKEYRALFNGEIKYYIVSHTKNGYGAKPCWFKVFIWNLIHRNKKLSYNYPNYHNHYSISVAAKNGVILEWDNQSMRNFIDKHQLHDKDTLTVYFLVPGGKNGHRCIGGITYLITEQDWKVVNKLRCN